MEWGFTERIGISGNLVRRDRNRETYAGGWVTRRLRGLEFCVEVTHVHVVRILDKVQNQTRVTESLRFDLLVRQID